jgi:hypothetical protein
MSLGLIALLLILVPVAIVVLPMLVLGGGTWLMLSLVGVVRRLARGGHRVQYPKALPRGQVVVGDVVVDLGRVGPDEKALMAGGRGR